MPATTEVAGCALAIPDSSTDGRRENRCGHSSLIAHASSSRKIPSLNKPLPYSHQAGLVASVAAAAVGVGTCVGACVCVGR